MTGLEKIVQQIRDEAQQAADAVIAQAKEEAGQLAAKAAEDARTQPGAILAKSKTDVQNHLAAARSAAELAQRRAVLAAKQEIIGEAIESARQSIYKLPDSDYFALILKMISKFSLPQEGELLFSPADLGRLPASFETSLAKSANGKLTVSRETRDIDGGFVLSYGGIEENCSIEALFYAARERLQDRVQELLFS